MEHKQTLIQKRTLLGAMRGFTLVELFVVIVILTGLTAIVSTSMISFSRHQAFNSFGSGVELDILEQQRRSIASVENTEFGVDLTSSIIGYFASTTASTSHTTNVPSDVTIGATLTGGATSFKFERLTGIPSATGTITLYSAGANATRTIIMRDSGLVERN